MRCQQCGHPNPEDHKFCGMCGARLEPASPAINISDNDPLDIEAPAYRFEDRSRSSALVTEFTDRDRQPERTRETSRNRASQGGVRAVVSVKSFPPDTVQEEAAEEEERHVPQRAMGIGGPSFLGLSYEGSNNGFVYDKPKNDGFIYDTDGQGAEYLLEDAPRRSHWRAWLLFFLIAAGSGLGYIQWRASHNEGPDLGSILAGNGASIDANHPVISPDAKPPQKPTPPTAGSLPTNDSEDNSLENASDSHQNSDNTSAKASTDHNATADAKAASPKSGDADEEDSDTSSETMEKSKATNTKSSDDDAGPESDGPSKAANGAKPAAIAEKPAMPKPLGDKDPLIIEANKYIQGRGVRQNCSTGMNLLRQAISAGNPEADVKMGALYWSGTCVTQSNVTAYEWFSRAHSLEPKNRWIERSRNSLLASMSPDERRRITY